MSWSARRERWRELLTEQADSGLSIAEFCRRSEVSQASFFQWRKKLGAAEAVRQPFVPVSLVAETGVSVEFPCGAVMRVPPGDERSLRQILARLLKSPERDR